MRKTALVILAAGIGSRYGAGVKQLAGVGPSGEIIIDYSIHDALRAGFDEIVFIIRKEIEDDFREIIGDRIAKIAPVRYAFQEKDSLPEGYVCPEDRVKPWGTAQALIAARDEVDCPFLVINADDFYGEGAFRVMHDYLTDEMSDSPDLMDYCMAGYVLGNTLSDLGTVCRGVCTADGDGYLVSVAETYDIHRTPDGSVVGEDSHGESRIIDPLSTVSMNMWGLKPNIFDELSEEFPRFLDTLRPGDLRSEFLLPEEVDRLVRSRRASVRILPVDSAWYGVTYREDVPKIRAAILEMVDEGVYGERLFG